MNVKNASRMVDELALLRYFPGTDDNARVGVVRIVCEMAANDEQVRWLVTRMLNLYSEWPGPRELRACFCSKFRPVDGVNACSTVYLDGIPSERASLPSLAAPEARLLAAPDGAKTEDARMNAAVQIADRIIDVKSSPLAGPATAAEIKSAPAWLRELEGYSE